MHTYERLFLMFMLFYSKYFTEKLYYVYNELILNHKKTIKCSLHLAPV